MIEEPNCYTRQCKHLLGVLSPNEGTEEGQVCVCTAFPQGIPIEIQDGRNLHTSPYPGDNGIQYEKEST